MAKRPAFQFYPGDWQRDTALRCCSVAARGLWIDMLCIMHQGEPYGHLNVKGTPLEPQALCRMVGATSREVNAWLMELEAAKVFSRTTTGTIFSRRMVSDERIRAARAAGGKLGGNPSLVGDKDNLNDNLPDDGRLDSRPTPSSSSSSSPSGNPLPPLLEDRPSFGMAWGLWPARARSKRGLAFEAWNLAIDKLAPKHGGHRAAVDWLLGRIKAYAKSPLAKTKFGPSIASWLEQGRWDDSPEAWEDSDASPVVPELHKPTASPKRDIAPILPT